MAFAVGAIFFPTLIVLISTAIRRYRSAPITSAADFVALAVVFDGLLMADPSQVLTHVKVDFGKEEVVPIALLFLTISFSIWFFCLFDVEPRIAAHYIRRRAFPYYHWLATWAASLAVLVLQIIFFTGRMASWFS